MSAPKSAPSTEMISVREFARRDGCDEKRVRKAKQDGYLGDPSATKLDAALVGTGWRQGNRRGADSTADMRTVRTPPVRTVRSLGLQELPGRDQSKPFYKPLADFPASLVALADGFAADASVELLRHLPETVARPIVATLLALCRRGAVEMLDEDDVPVPAGLATWADHPAFKTVVPTEAEWVEAAELAKG